MSSHSSDGGFFGEWVTDESGRPAFELDVASVLQRSSDLVVPRDGPIHVWHNLGGGHLLFLARLDGCIDIYQMCGTPILLSAGRHCPRIEVRLGSSPWKAVAKPYRVRFGCGYAKWEYLLSDSEGLARGFDFERGPGADASEEGCLASQSDHRAGDGCQGTRAGPWALRLYRKAAVDADGRLEIEVSLIDTSNLSDPARYSSGKRGETAHLRPARSPGLSAFSDTADSCSMPDPAHPAIEYRESWRMRPYPLVVIPLMGEGPVPLDDVAGFSELVRRSAYLASRIVRRLGEGTRLLLSALQVPVGSQFSSRGFSESVGDGVGGGSFAQRHLGGVDTGDLGSEPGATQTKSKLGIPGGSAIRLEFRPLPSKLALPQITTPMNRKANFPAERHGVTRRSPIAIGVHPLEIAVAIGPIMSGDAHGSLPEPLLTSIPRSLGSLELERAGFDAVVKVSGPLLVGDGSGRPVPLRLQMGIALEAGLGGGSQTPGPKSVVSGLEGAGPPRASGRSAKASSSKTSTVASIRDISRAIASAVKAIGDRDTGYWGADRRGAGPGSRHSGAGLQSTGAGAGPRADAGVGPHEDQGRGPGHSPGADPHLSPGFGLQHNPSSSALAEALSRELEWHLDQLRRLAIYDAYFGRHFVTQGSAYTFLQGAHGAPRDYAISVAALSPFDSALARSTLEVALMMMRPSGAVHYAHIGRGYCTDAGVHSQPSDLPIFLLWAICEYVESAGDRQFLEKKLPFYPLERGLESTVAERVALGFRWLKEVLGTGPHGLLRVGSGDWADPIALMVDDGRAFHAAGESGLNTAFAVHVFPRAAALLEPFDPESASEMRSFSNRLRAAMEEAWAGRWYLRGWDGRGNPLGDTHLFADVQAFCAIAGIGDEDRRETYVAELIRRNINPSPIGPLIVDRPHPVRLNLIPPGWDCNGGVWAAIGAFLVWGLASIDPQAAAKCLVSQTLAAHARAYPHIWYGIWSGPDCYNAHYAEKPGETFCLPPTPMCEFPVMNSNAHAGPLLAALKLSQALGVGAGSANPSP